MITNKLFDASTRSKQICPLSIPRLLFYNTLIHQSMVHMGLVKFLNFPQKSLKLAKSSVNTLDSLMLGTENFESSADFLWKLACSHSTGIFVNYV